MHDIDDQREYGRVDAKLMPSGIQRSAGGRLTIEGFFDEVHAFFFGGLK